MIQRFLRRGAATAICFSLCVLAECTAHAQLSLYSTVDLARRNNTAVRIAQADVAKAQASLDEAVAAYIPSMSIGSAAGYSYGFLGGVPSVVNAQIQSLLISFSQPDYIRSARAGLHTATLNLQDALDQVQLDCAVDYIQLDTITRQLEALDEEKHYVDKLDTISQDRVAAGVQSQIATTRAELTGAQADLKRLDLLAQAAVLRKRLSDMTGISEDSVRPESQTIPGAPLSEPARLNGFTAAVNAAYSDAASKHYVARGDDRKNYRPQIGFGFSYQYLDTTLNGYNQFYSHPLQPNNFGIAAQITLPLFDASNSAHARGSAADALRADTQAEQGRQQAEQQIVRLQQSFPELHALAHIADLQAQLASQQLQAVLLQLQNPPTGPNATALTPADEMQARIEERVRFSDALEAHFNLLKAQLSALRAAGQLGPWINQGAR